MYDVSATRKGLALQAQSRLSWQPQADGGYRLRLDIQALLLGHRVQTSVGRIDPQWGLQPLRFGDRNRSEQAAHFDRSRQPAVVRFSANTPDAPLQPHTQDRLSVLVQLAGLLLAQAQAPAAGHVWTLPTAGPRDVADWPFQVVGPQVLEGPGGRMDTLHLLRLPQHPYDNRVEVWLAPALDHLPARILWTQANGDVVDQRLRSAEH